MEGQAMSNVIKFRRFTREQLIQSERMELLQYHGTESGKRLHAFILDAYDDDMGEHADTPDEFISLCTKVFGDMERDRDE
jgi:DNA-binding PucR family transcriptional regulator